MEPVHDPRGSQWRVWDLHFHTPSSFDYRDRGTSNEDIVRKLTESGVSVVGVTDHHYIDVQRIAELQALAGDDIVVLPGIEVRTELGGSDSVHLVAILPEDCDLRSAWDTLRVKHDLQKQIDERGDESVYVDCRDFAESIHALGGVTIVHAGTKSNSIEEISNSHAFKQALKGDLARLAFDVFEIANIANAPSYERVVFPAIGKILPLITCSDSHDVRSYMPPECWIKADPSFYGLKQVLYDPRDRVYLGDEPPLLERTRQSQTQYIDSISFRRAEDSNLPEKWFEGVSLPLNPGLVAIIGNKGSGKSALAEALGLVGGCRNTKYFSFLHKARFLQGRTPKATHFVAAVRWLDGTTTELLLSSENSEVEQRVRYIPQNYLETICNELEVSETSEFTAQIEHVIMSHLPPDDRDGHETLLSLIGETTSEIKVSIDHTREKVRELNASIADMENRLGEAYRAELTRRLVARRREVAILDEEKPSEVQKPPDDPDGSTEMKTLTAEVDALDSEVSGLEESLQQNSRAQSTVRRGRVSCERLLQGVDNLAARFEDLKELWDAEGETAGVKLSEVVTQSMDRKPLENRLQSLEDELRALQNDADPAIDSSAAWQLADRKARRGQLLIELGAPDQAYQKYLDDLKKWNDRRAELTGNATTPDTLVWLEAQADEMEQLPGRLSVAMEQRKGLVTELYRGVEKWRAVYVRVYEPVQRYIDSHPLISATAKFEFSAAIADKGFAEGFFGLVHQGRKGSFCRDGDAAVRKLLDNADFQSAEGTIAFLDEVLESLSVDMRDGTQVAIDTQLKDGVSRTELYDLLFSLTYLEPTYSLRWAGKNLDLLSPGEKGALLLVFYLLIDKNSGPLIIDQPEENLDNQTVYGILVPCISEARQRRQIVLVTHNPNLAVACDADQVIRASLTTDGLSQLEYESGALESPSVSSAVVDVLEGTRPAFEKRERKYVAAMPDWTL